MIVCHVFHSLLVMLSQLLCCRGYRPHSNTERKRQWKSSVGWQERIFFFLLCIPLSAADIPQYVCMYPSPVSPPPPAVLVALYTQYIHYVSHLLCIVWTSKIPQNHSCKALYTIVTLHTLYIESRREQVYTVLSYIMTNCSIETILYAKIFVSILVNLAW